MLFCKGLVQESDHSQEWAKHLGDKTHSGVLLIKNTENARKIIKAWNQVTDTHPDYCWQYPPEERGFNDFILPEHASSISVCRDYYLMNCRQGQYIRHLSGQSHSQRIFLLQKYLCQQEKLFWSEWKSIRTLEIFSNSGCHRRCSKCDKLEMRLRCPDYELTPADMQKIVDTFVANRCSISHISFTGGEPLLWAYAVQCAEMIRASGVCHWITLTTSLVEGVDLEPYEKAFDGITVSTYPDNQPLVDLVKDNPKYHIINKLYHNLIPQKRCRLTTPCTCPCASPFLFDGKMYFCPIAANLLHSTHVDLNEQEKSRYVCSIEEFLHHPEKRGEFGYESICEYCHGNNFICASHHNSVTCQSNHPERFIQV